ncbi:MAG: hypothetical protein ACR2HA_02230 [Nocardioides sp.]
MRHAAANDMDLVLHMRRIPARAWKHLRQLVVVNEMRDRTTVMGSQLRTTGRTYWSFTPLTTAHWVALPNVEVTMVKDVAGFRQWCATSAAG